jgi:hypothetical protein
MPNAAPRLHLNLPLKRVLQFRKTFDGKGTGYAYKKWRTRIRLKFQKIKFLQ